MELILETHACTTLHLGLRMEKKKEKGRMEQEKEAYQSSPDPYYAHRGCSMAIAPHINMHVRIKPSQTTMSVSTDLVPLVSASLD